MADPRNHATWWPHLTVTVTRDRGVKGQRWAVDGQIVGSMEIWVEPFWQGAIVHHYVRGVRGVEEPRQRHGCATCSAGRPRCRGSRTWPSSGVVASVHGRPHPVRLRRSPPPGAVLDVIADFERYPEWAEEVNSVTVLSEDGDGWADQVEFHLHAGAIKDHYVLEYDWDIAKDGTGSVSWHLVPAHPAQGPRRHLRARPHRHGHPGHLRPRGRPHHADDRHAQAQGREAHHQHRADELKKRAEG